MKIVKCKTCKKDVLETVIRCPHCDSQGPKRARRINIVMAILCVILAAGMGTMIYNRKEEVQRTREEIDEARRAEKVHWRVKAASFYLRTSVADLTSIRIDDIKTNYDGSIVCYWYSVRDNGGRFHKKKAVFTEGDLHYSAGAWEIYCGGKMMEVQPLPPPP